MVLMYNLKRVSRINQGKIGDIFPETEGIPHYFRVLCIHRINNAGFPDHKAGVSAITLEM